MLADQRRTTARYDEPADERRQLGRPILGRQQTETDGRLFADRQPQSDHVGRTQYWNGPRGQALHVELHQEVQEGLGGYYDHAFDGRSRGTRRLPSYHEAGRVQVCGHTLATQESVFQWIVSRFDVEDIFRGYPEVEGRY